MEEIAAAKSNMKTAWLDIDGIEHLTDTPGSFVYRLILSPPVHFGPDQTITFHIRNPKGTFQAVIVRSDDEELIVECQKPLPTEDFEGFPVIEPAGHWSASDGDPDKFPIMGCTEGELAANRGQVVAVVLGHELVGFSQVDWNGLHAGM